MIELGSYLKHNNYIPNHYIYNFDSSFGEIKKKVHKRHKFCQRYVHIFKLKMADGEKSEYFYKHYLLLLL